MDQRDYQKYKQQTGGYTQPELVEGYDGGSPGADLNAADASASDSGGTIRKVDSKVMIIVILWFALTAFQYALLQPPPGYRLVLGNVTRVDSIGYHGRGLGRTYSRTLIDWMEVKYQFTVDGMNISDSVSTFPVIFDWSPIDKSQWNNVAIYHDPKDPQKSTLPCVAPSFAQQVFWNYGLFAMIAILGMVVFPAFDAMNGKNYAPKEGSLADDIINMDFGTVMVVGLIFLAIAGFAALRFYSATMVKSIPALTEELRSDPNNYDLLMQRAERYQQHFDSYKAIDDYTHALEVRPKSIEAYKKRAEVYDVLCQTISAQNDRAAAAALEHH